MKKLSVLLLAAALVIAFSLPAAAVEHIFGGYWRARAFTQQNFTGEDDTEARDLTRTDSRTRLFYTAQFSDTFKFVNQFEFNWVYGDTGMGRIGADGNQFLIKQSYAHFHTLQKQLEWKIGAQGYTVARGFLFSDDFSGAYVAWDGDGFKIPFIWVKGYEGGAGLDANDNDVDYYVLNPAFKFAGLGINPYFMMKYSEDATAWAATGRSRSRIAFDDMSIFWLGADFDYKYEGWSFWASAIWNSGDGDRASDGTSMDFQGYLFGLGAKGAIGPLGLHGQFVYSSGDDNPNDENIDSFFNPRGASYYWAEIMGMGLFDAQTTANSPGDQISNIWFIGGGVDYKLMENLKLGLDIWYAELAEKEQVGAEGSELGTEIDLKATWNIMPKLNLDVVAAYLFTEDGTYKGPNDSDAYELGTRLSLSF